MQLPSGVLVPLAKPMQSNGMHATGRHAQGATAVARRGSTRTIWVSAQAIWTHGERCAARWGFPQQGCPAPWLPCAVTPLRRVYNFKHRSGSQHGAAIAPSEAQCVQAAWHHAPRFSSQIHLTCQLPPLPLPPCPTHHAPPQTPLPQHPRSMAGRPAVRPPDGAAVGGRGGQGGGAAGGPVIRSLPRGGEAGGSHVRGGGGAPGAAAEALWRCARACAAVCAGLAGAGCNSSHNLPTPAHAQPPCCGLDPCPCVTRGQCMPPPPLHAGLATARPCPQ